MPDEHQPGVAVFHIPEFKRNLRHLSKKHRPLRTDLQPILDALVQGQRVGDKIPGVKYDVYKVRAKNSDARKGKSGGYRLIFQVAKVNEIVLITVYSKSEQGDVSAKTIKQIIEEFEAEVG